MHTLHPNHRRLDDDDQIAMERLYAGVDNLSNRRKGASRHHFSIVRRDDDHLTGHRTIRVSPNHGENGGEKVVHGSGGMSLLRAAQ